MYWITEIWIYEQFALRNLHVSISVYWNTEIKNLRVYTMEIKFCLKKFQISFLKLL